MKLTHEIVSLRTKHAFTIARGGGSDHRVNLVKITDKDGAFGVGEGNPSRYYGENPDSTAVVLNQFQAILEKADAWSLDAIELEMGKMWRGNGSAKSAYDAGWQAHAGGHTLTHRAAFATTNQFRLTTRAAVSISHTGQPRRNLLIAVELILWILALLWWARGRTRSSRDPASADARAAARRARADRRRGFPDDLGSDVEFWEQA